MAPVLYLDTTLNKPSLYHLLVRLKIVKIFDFFNITNIPFNDPAKNWFINWVMKFTCRHVTFICKSLFEIASDSDPSLLDLKNLNEYFKYYPSNSSIKSLKHFLQFIVSKKPEFKKYDYGPNQNLKLYNQIEPPIYDIKKVNLI